MLKNCGLVTLINKSGHSHVYAYVFIVTHTDVWNQVSQVYWLPTNCNTAEEKLSPIPKLIPNISIIMQHWCVLLLDSLQFGLHYWCLCMLQLCVSIMWVSECVLLTCMILKLNEWVSASAWNADLFAATDAQFEIVQPSLHFLKIAQPSLPTPEIACYSRLPCIFGILKCATLSQDCTIAKKCRTCPSIVLGEVTPDPSATSDCLAWIGIDSTCT